MELVDEITESPIHPEINTKGDLLTKLAKEIPGLPGRKERHKRYIQEEDLRKKVEAAKEKESKKAEKKTGDDAGQKKKGKKGKKKR